MSKFKEFFINLFLRTPQEILVALLRLILFILFFVLTLLLKLWEWIKWLVSTKTLYPEKTEEDCGKLPEPIIRRPDPCIYSQTYLMSQEPPVPVTWDNPDIQVAPAANPGEIEPDSYHLQEDTDYIVFVHVHNASTDAAIGVKVRLVYRPWSFNSPDLMPVETDANGNEIARSVDISPMGTTTTQFHWHTPKILDGQEAQHFCLQVHLSHPLDTNLANNMGQENTAVYSQNPGFVSPGEIAEIDIPLFNTRRQEQTVRFRWDAYEINRDDQAELRIKTATSKARMPLSDRLGHLLPAVDSVSFHPKAPPPGPTVAAATVGDSSSAIFGQVVFGSPKSRFVMKKHRYIGFEVLRRTILGRDYSLPDGMEVTVTLPDTPVPTLMAPNQARIAHFNIRVPDDAPPGSRYPLNLLAETENGTLLGGVTVYFNVRT